MLRAIGGAIAGYVMMVVIIVLATIVATPSMLSGQPMEATATTAYMVVMLIVGLIAAFAGGHLATALAKTERLKATYILMGIILVLGILSSVASIKVLPMWYLILTVIVGLVGVYLGGTHYKSHQS